MIQQQESILKQLLHHKRGGTGASAPPSDSPATDPSDRMLCQEINRFNPEEYSSPLLLTFSMQYHSETILPGLAPWIPPWIVLDSHDHPFFSGLARWICLQFLAQHTLEPF